MYYSALLGHPVEHSVSSVLFHMLAESINVEYAHIKVDVADKNDLFTCIKALKTLGFLGANVTMPYKSYIMQHCDEISNDAKMIGAVNTISFAGGKIIGHNTDYFGLITAIEEKLNKVSARDNILVIGSGGAARAAIFALYKFCGSITVLSINTEQGNAVATDLSLNGKRKIVCDKLSRETLLNQIICSDLIINATPVNMYPNISQRIVPYDILEKAASTSDFSKKKFFDVVFNPYYTCLLQDAKTLGARVCPGLYMMIFQAIKALDLWVGRYPIDIDTELISNKLMTSLVET